MNTKTLLIGMLVASISVSSWAVGFFGTPTAELGEGQWSIGYDFSYSNQDFKDATLTASDGTPLARLRSEDFKVQRHYATFSYGLIDEMDIYISLGGAIVKGKIGFVGVPGQLEGDFSGDFAWGWGARYTFFNDDKVDWGAAIQMNWLDTDLTDPVGDKWEFESYDILVSAGPTVDMGDWKLYGGPFYYHLNGELTITETGGNVFEADAKAESNFGAFIGVTFEPTRDTVTSLSFASTVKGGWCFGAGLGFKF